MHAARHATGLRGYGGTTSMRTLGRAYPALASDGTDLYVFTGDNFFRIEDDQETPVFPNKKISAVLYYEEIQSCH